MPTPASLDDTAPVPSRNPQTDDDYKKGGQKLLDRALRLYPAAGGPIEAFIRLCDNPDWVLRSSTTRTYMARMIKRIEIDVTTGQYEPEHAIAGVTKIYELLEQRRGHPEARTSRLKCMEVTKEEVQLIADDLQKRIAAHKTDMVNKALCLFVQLAPRFGLRPCEYERARIVGRTLVILNAKFSNARAPGVDRRICLERVPEKLVRGIDQLIGMIRALVEKHGSWQKLHDILAERLARICRRLRLVRISLYSLRHAAIATWKKAKLSRVEIAAMAGHISVKTASRHYAPSRHGWDPQTVRIKGDPQTISVVRQYSESPSTFRLPERWSPPENWSAPSLSMSP
jgi:hypothetical protein